MTNVRLFKKSPAATVMDVVDRTFASIRPLESVAYTLRVIGRACRGRTTPAILDKSTAGHAELDAILSWPLGTSRGISRRVFWCRAGDKIFDRVNGRLLAPRMGGSSIVAAADTSGSDAAMVATVDHLVDPHTLAGAANRAEVVKIAGDSTRHREAHISPRRPHQLDPCRGFLLTDRALRSGRRVHGDSYAYSACGGVTIPACHVVVWGCPAGRLLDGGRTQGALHDESDRSPNSLGTLRRTSRDGRAGWGGGPEAVRALCPRPRSAALRRTAGRGFIRTGAHASGDHLPAPPWILRGRRRSRVERARTAPVRPFEAPPSGFTLFAQGGRGRLPTQPRRRR